MAKRSRARERKQERQQEKQRNRQILIVGAIIVVVLFIAGAYLLTSLPAEAPLPDTLSRYEDLRKGFTDEEAYPRLGSPNAPVTLMEFSSFACPGCLEFEQSVFPLLLPRIEKGEVQFIFVPLTTGSVQNPDGANRTALCAGEQGKFWEMHDTLFSWHATFGSNAFQDARLRAGVDALGLNMGAFNNCFRNNNTNNVLSSAQGEGVTSTPTVRIDGATVAASFEAIDAAISDKGPFAELEPGTISGMNALEEVETEDTSTEEEVEATAESDEAVTDDEATGEEVEEATAEATESSD